MFDAQCFDVQFYELRASSVDDDGGDDGDDYFFTGFFTWQFEVPVDRNRNFTLSIDGARTRSARMVPKRAASVAKPRNDGGRAWLNHEMMEAEHGLTAH